MSLRGWLGLIVFGFSSVFFFWKGDIKAAGFFALFAVATSAVGWGIKRIREEKLRDYEERKNKSNK